MKAALTTAAVLGLIAAMRARVAEADAALRSAHTVAGGGQ